MIYMPLTRTEFVLFNLNGKIKGLLNLIYTMQIEGFTEVTFSPGRLFRNEFVTWLSNNRGFTVTSTSAGANFQLVTKITWG